MRFTSFLFITLFILIPLATFAGPGELHVILKDTTPLQLSERGSLASADMRLSTLLDEHKLDRYAFICTKTDELKARDQLFVRLQSAAADFDAASAREALAATGLFKAVALPFTVETFVLPNDPMLSNQWAITDPVAGIQLPGAWDIEQGDSGTVIAILDTGVDVGHPDLAGNMWQNPGEIAGNGLDDDSNGYIDDIWGWDTGDNDNNPSPVVYLELGLDVGFHGTHCAGIASAATDNGVGIAGTGWDCSLMGLKMVQTDVGMTDLAITNAFLYCAEMRPDVISMSFGGPDEGGMADFMQGLIDIVLAEGIVCVAAAGNNSDSVLMYPAACAGVISVSATDSNNQLASFSTYGSWVDVNAPGAQIWSCVQRNYSWDFLTELLYMLTYGYDGLNPYMYCDGTSMACPMVAGVCGLIRSATPGMSPAAVRTRLIETGDEIVFSQPCGVKVNAEAAVDGLALSAVGDPPVELRLAGNFPNPFNPSTTIRFHLPTAGPVRVTVYDLAGGLVRTLIRTTRPAGDNTVVWNGRDNAGRQVASGAYFARLAFSGTTVISKMVLLK